MVVWQLQMTWEEVGSISVLRSVLERLNTTWPEATYADKWLRIIASTGNVYLPHISK